MGSGAQDIDSCLRAAKHSGDVSRHARYRRATDPKGMSRILFNVTETHTRHMPAVVPVRRRKDRCRLRLYQIDTGQQVESRAQRISAADQVVLAPP
jgi:hypothetical protein